MVRCTRAVVALIVMVQLSSLRFAAADDLVNKATQADLASAKYGLTGKGVVVAILDRGLDYTHPDFRNANGTTRIRWMLDMSGQQGCNAQNVGSPAPVEYTEAQINAALKGTGKVPERDAVGHGTVTTGLAAGNGSADAGGLYAGLAPDADLIVVKLTSEGAPAHGAEPAETAFQGCIPQALAWLDAKLKLVGEPAVALIDSGTQWGPIDGTSIVSRSIDSAFGASTPGRIFVLPSGDEGGLPNHAGGAYSDTSGTVVHLSRSSKQPTAMQLWYTGSVPAKVTLAFEDGTTVGPVGPGDYIEDQNGITIIQYAPGDEAYPWTSTSGDRAVCFYISGHAGAGSVTIEGTGPGMGNFDVYGDVDGPNVTPITSLTDHLRPGRLTDYASTIDAIIDGCSVVRTSYIDVNGEHESITNQGPIGGLWVQSSGGPTRNGRLYGVDVVTPGENSFAAYARNSYWATYTSNEIEGGGGWYGRHGATSASSPIAVGAVALMLELDPELTEAQAKQILRETAKKDSYTGATPNARWGYGKLDVLAALDAVAPLAGPTAIPSAASISFPQTAVGAKSAAKTVTIANTGIAALEFRSISTSGNFAETNTCGTKLAAKKTCEITVVFKPSSTGAHTGTLTIDDDAPDHTQTIELSGSAIKAAALP